MNCVNNSPCGCNRTARVGGCGCGDANGTARTGCGCGEANGTARNGCGCNGNARVGGCGCGDTNGTARTGCGCGCQNSCCNPCKIRGASFLAPEAITVLTNQPVPLIDQFNFSCGDIFHEVDSHRILLSEGIYEINYNFNAFSHCDTLLTFGLLVNGLIDPTTQVVETVDDHEWNALSKTFFLSVFTSTEIALLNLSSNGIEIKNLNLTIKKVSNVLVV